MFLCSLPHFIAVFVTYDMCLVVLFRSFFSRITLFGDKLKTLNKFEIVRQDAKPKAQLTIYLHVFTELAFFFRIYILSFIFFFAAAN